MRGYDRGVCAQGRRGGAGYGHGADRVVRPCKKTRVDGGPVYSGKISYGRRRTEKVHGTRNEYRQVKKDDYLLVDGLHEGLKVSSLYIAQIKKKCGLDVGENYNLSKSENARQPQCTPEKEEAIMQAFKHFGMI